MGEHGTHANLDGTSYTFFGVPIPPLNLNNIWGPTKNNGKRLKDSRRNSLPRKSSTIDHDGFTPMLPGTGVFQPLMTTPDNTFFGGEVDSEEVADTIYRNKTTSVNKIVDSGNPSRYHFSSTTESSSHYDRFPSSDYGYSKFVNTTTRDSLFESATMNLIVRSTAIPSIDNNQPQKVASATSVQNDDPIDESESLHKLSTGNINRLSLSTII